jgi:hypothetical protein
MRNVYIIFVRKPGRKRVLIRSRGRWEDNVIMDLRERGSEDVDCMQLA